mmetsp:Transcript_22693/g.55987  ORF Transcript_22693/g.55987 Transcript_22693/m.55987 type:complete len:250 (-) Transcript_22693:114-863(-)
MIQTVSLVTRTPESQCASCQLVDARLEVLGYVRLDGEERQTVGLTADALQLGKEEQILELHLDVPLQTLVARPIGHISTDPLAAAEPHQLTPLLTAYGTLLPVPTRHHYRRQQQRRPLLVRTRCPLLPAALLAPHGRRAVAALHLTKPGHTAISGDDAVICHSSCGGDGQVDNFPILINLLVQDALNGWRDSGDDGSLLEAVVRECDGRAAEEHPLPPPLLLGLGAAGRRRRDGPGSTCLLCLLFRGGG